MHLHSESREERNWDRENSGYRKGLFILNATLKVCSYRTRKVCLYRTRLGGVRDGMV